MAKQEQASVLSYVSGPDATQQVRGWKWWAFTIVGWLLTIFGGLTTLNQTFAIAYVIATTKEAHNPHSHEHVTFVAGFYWKVARGVGIAIAALLTGLWMLRLRRRRRVKNNNV